MVAVKICGIKTTEVAQAACEAGASYVGFVHFKKSPRHLSFEEMAVIADKLPSSIKTVAVMVNPSDIELQTLKQTVVPDYIQLHGDETLARIDRVRSLLGCRIIKAIPIAKAEDLKAVNIYSSAVEMLLLDAKTPKDTLPGGMGMSFDWALLERFSIEGDWMLSGGLSAMNVAEAIRWTHAPIVDVSSGVETAPGVKDVEKIRHFIQAVKQH